EAPLEVLSLPRELREPLLLFLVLLLGKRVHLAELLASPLAPLEPLRERVPVIALGGLDSGLLDPALGVLALGFEPRELDVDRGRPFARLRSGPPRLDLRRAE